jgi:hypothetical protein
MKSLNLTLSQRSCIWFSEFCKYIMHEEMGYHYEFLAQLFKEEEELM